MGENEVNGWNEENDLSMRQPPDRIRLKRLLLESRRRRGKRFVEKRWRPNDNRSDTILGKVVQIPFLPSSARLYLSIRKTRKFGIRNTYKYVILATLIIHSRNNSPLSLRNDKWLPSAVLKCILVYFNVYGLRTRAGQPFSRVEGHILWFAKNNCKHRAVFQLGDNVKGETSISPFLDSFVRQIHSLDLFPVKYDRALFLSFFFSPSQRAQKLSSSQAD